MSFYSKFLSAKAGQKRNTLCTLPPGLLSLLLAHVSKPILRAASLHNSHYVIQYPYSFYLRISKRNSLLLPIHNAGFFSCIVTTIFSIRQLQLDNLPIPCRINNIFTMNSFKSPFALDTWNIFFAEPDPLSLHHMQTVKPAQPISIFNHHADYHNLYHTVLDSAWIKLVFKTYLTPTPRLRSRALHFIEKYQINFAYTIAVCIRGTDKYTELDQSPLSEYFKVVDNILATDPSLRILIQTDQMQVRNEFLTRYRDACFYFTELPSTLNATVLHLSHDAPNDRISWSLDLLSATICLSKCKYVVTHTGNMGFFISVLAFINNVSLLTQLI